MVERIAITVIVAAAVAGVVLACTLMQKRRSAAQAAGSRLLDGLRSDLPVIIYFWSEMCVPCKAVQTPALDRIEQDLAGCVQVVRVDAAVHTDEAKAWGVLTTPTTILLGPGGQQINNRVVRADELKTQLATISGEIGLCRS
ncbi:MAG: thioredoxin family protein [Anaerolineae bacterium]